MTSSDASRLTLGLVLLAGATLAAAVTLPWFEADWSSGRRTPAEGLQAPEETGAIHHSWTDGVQGSRGDAPPADPAAHAQATQAITWLTWTAAGMAAIVLAGEIPGVRRAAPRRVSLAASVLGCLAAAGAALACWFLVPPAYGIGDGPFTMAMTADGYWRTSLGLGWTAATATIPIFVGTFLAKYQAGWADPDAIHDFARRTAVKR